jgi:hypothetical protein
VDRGEPESGELGRRRRNGQGAVLRVCATTTGLIEVDYLGPELATEGVIEQGIDVGQAKATADEHGEQ